MFFEDMVLTFVGVVVFVLNGTKVVVLNFYVNTIGFTLLVILGQVDKLWPHPRPQKD